MLIYARIKGYGKQDRQDRLPVLAATKQAAFALMMPVIILGGIYGGIFTPTEASVVAVFYALAVGLFIHRELGLPISARYSRRRCCRRR